MIDADVFLNPIDIGKWESYRPYSNQEQIKQQLENLTILPVDNDRGSVYFIYTKRINQLNTYLESVIKDIKISDTTTALENEIYYTAKIEGSHTTRKRTTELHNGTEIDINNSYSEKMVKNGFDATKLMNIYGNRLNEEILCKVWNTLTEGCRDNINIQGEKYRNGEIEVGGHTGANPNEIPILMSKWINFYNSKELDTKPFIKACILHQTFETIHPFCDGNGRLGRLLMNNYLISRGIESAKAVSFSMEIDRTRSAYDAAFIDSENQENDCTPFVEYMLERMADSYERAIETQNHINNKTSIIIETNNDIYAILNINNQKYKWIEMKKNANETYLPIKENNITRNNIYYRLSQLNGYSAVDIGENVDIYKGISIDNGTINFSRNKTLYSCKDAEHIVSIKDYLR